MITVAEILYEDLQYGCHSRPYFICGRSVFLTVRGWFIYQFLPVLHRLEILLLPFLSVILLFQVGLDGFVLCIEVAHILVEIIRERTNNRHSTNKYTIYIIPF